MPAERHSGRPFARAVSQPAKDAADGHAATLLPSGDVLIAGGEGKSGDISGAELYG